MKRCTAAEPDRPPAERPLRATFIVRMWSESAHSGTRDWRGQVEHVQSGERRAVSGAGGLLDLLSAWLSKEEE